MESVGDDASGFDHLMNVRSRRDAHQNTFMGAKLLLHPVLSQIIDKLAIHHVGRKHRGEFPVIREALLALESVELQFRGVLNRILSRPFHDLENAVEKIKKITNSDKVSLLGYCWEDFLHSFTFLHIKRM